MVDLDKGGIWRKRGYYPPESFYTLDKHATSVMVWAGNCPGGYKTKFIRCPERMNSEKYCEMIIKNKIVENLNSKFGNNYIFQQDGAPYHRSKYTRLNLLVKFPSIIPWPAKSPDLSPIEQLWDYIKNKIRGIYFNNSDELFERLSNEWDVFPAEIIHNHYSSLRARCIVCQKINGECLNGHWREVHQEHDLYRKSL